MALSEDDLRLLWRAACETLCQVERESGSNNVHSNTADTQRLHRSTERTDRRFVDLGTRRTVDRPKHTA